MISKEWPCRRKDGEIIHLTIAAAPVHDAFGAVVAAVIVAGDVSERVRAETALRESEAKYRDLVENINDVIYGTDRAGVLTYISPRVQALTGYRPSEMVGKPLSRFFATDETARRPPAVAGPAVERQLITAAGDQLWVSDSSRPVVAGRHTIGVRGVLTDITARKAAEESAARQCRRLAALREIDSAFGSSLDLRATMKVFLENARSQLGVDAAAVFLYNPRRENLEYFIGRGLGNRLKAWPCFQVGEGLVGLAARERRTMTWMDAPGRGARDSPTSPGIQPAAWAVMGFQGSCAVPLIAKGKLTGVLQVFQRAATGPDREFVGFLETMAAQAALFIDDVGLFRDLQRSNRELAKAYDATLEGWVRALDLRDKETEGHTQRVTKMTVRLVRAMGWEGEDLVNAGRGALLHDIGKLGIPDRVLLKAGQLSPEEWAIMRRHPEYALNMLSPITYLRGALDIPYAHHERWDGSGYPRGLKGEEIPLAARIFAVVDVWDALRSDRPYRKAWAADQVKDYLRSRAGKEFDPMVVGVFLDAEVRRKDAEEAGGGETPRTVRGLGQREAAATKGEPGDRS